MFKGLLNLLGFIRFRICFLVIFVVASGYLLSNPLGLGLAPIVLASFFLCAGGYAHNNITDKEEDLINRKAANPLAYNSKGPLIVAACFLLALIFAMHLSFISLILSVAVLIISLGYSFFRIKRYPLVKNLYTGFGLPLFFLLGASNALFAIETLLYYLLISVFILIGSLVADLRDYIGDKKTGIKTLPVILGYSTARKLTYFLLALFLVLALSLNLHGLHIFIPFVLLISVFLYAGKHSIAHSCGGLSFIALAVWLVI